MKGSSVAGKRKAANRTKQGKEWDAIFATYAEVAELMGFEFDGEFWTEAAYAHVPLNAGERRKKAAKMIQGHLAKHLPGSDRQCRTRNY